MKKEHLSVLTQAEQAAFYEAPDFNVGLNNTSIEIESMVELGVIKTRGLLFCPIFVPSTILSMCSNC